MANEINNTEHPLRSESNSPTTESAGQGPPATHLAKSDIDWANGTLGEVTDDVLTAIAASAGEPDIFQQGNHLVRVRSAEDNAKRLKAEVLQKMMRHKSYKTTLGYINQAEHIEQAVADLKVPDVLLERHFNESPVHGPNEGQ